MRENLITSVKRCNDRQITNVSLESALASIQTGKYKDAITRIREAPSREIRNQLKQTTLPAFAFSGLFSESVKNAAFQAPSGVICLDIDHLDGNVEQDKQIIAGLPFVLACFVSPSGDGLKVLVKVPAIHSDKELKDMMPSLTEAFQSNGYEIDRACKDVARLCFVSDDPRLYVNWQCSEFVPVIKPKEKPKTEPVSTANKVLEDLKEALAYLPSEDYADWINIGLALKSYGDAAIGLWLEWSAQYSEFDSQEAIKKWQSFNPTEITYKSIFGRAMDAGWKNGKRKIDSSIRVMPEQKPKPIDMSFLDADVMADNAKPPKYLINKILETNSIGILAGASQSYKSFMSLAMAHSICTGADFFGQKVFDKNKVMYVCGEGQSALSRRMKAVKINHGGFDGNMVVFNGKLRIDDDGDIEALSQRINSMMPALVIFDTFSSMNSKTNENDNSEVSNVLSMLNRHLSNGFTTYLIIHHFGKDSERGIRGASAFGNNVDFVFTMARDGDEASMSTTLTCKKMKDGDPFVDIHAVADLVPLGIYEQDGSESTSLVLRHYDGKLSGVKPDNYTIIMMEYENLLENNMIPTEVGNGVKCDMLYDRLDKHFGSRDTRRKAMSRFRERLGEENAIEINNILVIRKS